MPATVKITAYGVDLGGVLIFAGTFEDCSRKAKWYPRASVMPLYEAEGLARLEAVKSPKHGKRSDPGLSSPDTASAATLTDEVGPKLT